MSSKSEWDVLVIGGGMVGMAVAYGLAKQGERVALLDEGDDAYRASRGNFGLVWVQGKGLENPDYSRWTIGSATAWPAFANELEARTGVYPDLSQPGGLSICLNDRELSDRANRLSVLREKLGGVYPFEVLNARQVKEMIPQVGPTVAGAIYCPLDGHASPLRLLHALVKGFESAKGQLISGVRVSAIDTLSGGGFKVHTNREIFSTKRVVLSAGLGNRDLAPLVGLKAPVAPNRGQILVTERVQPFLNYPTLHVRQTNEGVVQIGDSQEDVGLDDQTTLAQLSRIALRAQLAFPLLEHVNIVRSWGALRVMSPDGFPIYQASTESPGAFVVTCHSGVTLAAQHAGALASWILGAQQPAETISFNAERFDV
jgi:glycine/D-amino acid oxidase-like deaminating enzyme